MYDRAKFERLDVQKEYDKRQATGKHNINLVVIGERTTLYNTNTS